MVTANNRMISYETKNKQLRYLYVSLMMVLLLTKPVLIVGDDSFCTETWNYLNTGAYVVGAIRANGNLYTWGVNNFGGLGYGDTDLIQQTPRLVGNATDTWKMIAIVQSFTLGLKTDGTVYAWGSNNYDNIGVPGPDTITSPTRVLPLQNCSYVANMLDFYSSFAVCNGNLYGWGANANYQLGRTDPFQSKTPLQIGNDSDWSSIYTSKTDQHVCGLKTNGNLFCWGANDEFQVGDNSTTDRASPFMIGNATDKWIYVGFGQASTIALKSDGTLYGWGNNSNGILGENRNLPIPTRIAPDLTFKSIAVNSKNVIAIASDGTLYGWGDNTYTQVNSDTDVTTQISPNQISTDSTWMSVFSHQMEAIDSGMYFAIKNDRSLFGWGDNRGGQLGIGSTTATKIAIPTQILPGKTFKSVSSHDLVSGGIDSNGGLFMWGNNAYSGIGDHTTTDATTPVSCSTRTKQCSNHQCLTL